MACVVCVGTILGNFNLISTGLKTTQEKLGLRATCAVVYDDAVIYGLQWLYTICLAGQSKE